MCHSPHLRSAHVAWLSLPVVPWSQTVNLDLGVIRTRAGKYTNHLIILELRRCTCVNHLVSRGAPHPARPVCSTPRIGGVTLAARAAPATKPVPARDVRATSVGRFDVPYYVAPARRYARLFVVEKAGRIRVMLNGRTLVAPFLDISSQVPRRRARPAVARLQPRLYPERPFLRLLLGYRQAHPPARVSALGREPESRRQ